MDLDYISTRRLSRFYNKLKDWLSLNYSTKVELAEATKDMRGATEQFAGAHGLVPTPAAADRNKFLKGDATWAELPVATASTDGLMSAADKAKLTGIATGAQVNTIEHITANSTELTISGKTVDIPVFTGATAQAAGSVGLVPAPTAGSANKVLKGDGTWGVADNQTYVGYDPLNLELQLDFRTGGARINGHYYEAHKVGNRYWTSLIDEDITGEYTVSPVHNIKLYNSANIAAKLAEIGVSDGWRLPTSDDVDDLIAFQTSNSIPMSAFFAVDNQYSLYGNTVDNPGTDDYGFGAYQTGNGENGYYNSGLGYIFMYRSGVYDVFTWMNFEKFYKASQYTPDGNYYPIRLVRDA